MIYTTHITVYNNFYIHTGVYDTPKVLNITVWPNSTNVTVGDNVSLLCEVKAPASATIVQWFMNGSLINESMHYGEGDEILSNLTLTTVTQKDGGNYTCSCFYNNSIVSTKTNITCNPLSVLIHVMGKLGCICTLNSISIYY